MCRVHDWSRAQRGDGTRLLHHVRYPQFHFESLLQKLSSSTPLIAMIYSYFFAAAALFLAVLPYASADEGVDSLFLAGFLVDHTKPHATECTDVELDLIRASMTDSIANGGDKFFDTTDDSHVDGRFVDLNEQEFTDIEERFVDGGKEVVLLH